VVEIASLMRRLVDVLAPAIAYLRKAGPEWLSHDLHIDTYSIVSARRVLDVLGRLASSNEELGAALEAFSRAPEDGYGRERFSSIGRGVLSRNLSAARELKAILEESVPGDTPSRSSEFHFANIDDTSDETLRRLEAFRLLRSGIDPGRIAARFKMPISEVFRINYNFSVAGAEGLLLAGSTPSWSEQLDGNDPLLRRLEMVRLLRDGTPASVVARQFEAIEDYVVLIGQKFAKYGLPGIMTEADVERFRTANPEEIRICSYNLQGVRSDGALRLRRMARELCPYRPDVIAFQEVINGAGVDDTGGQIAYWLSSMTGEHYKSYFTYCHQFMDKFPEGVAVCARVPIRAATSIDLSANLAKGLRPSMDRHAQMVETVVSGKRIIVVSVHFDHIELSEVRRAQADKLLSELDRITADADCYALVLAGDFNDTEDSAALKLLKEAGYRDSYRICHKKGGDTFAVPRPDVRIDYILVKGAAEVISAEVILNDPDFSDHLGIVTVLK
jgi:endonuclease/exonuclease/phosphatase family metal-dependent hydrolase